MKRVHSAIAGLLTLACAPKITTFSVLPARACAADTVTVHFSTNGDAELRVMPRRPGIATDTTRYVLVTNKSGKLEQRFQDVLIYTGKDRDTLVFGPTKKLAPDSVHVVDTLRTDTWPDFVRLGEISSASGRPIVIRHAGKSTVLPAGTPSIALAGTPVSGDWDLRAALLPGEKFATPGHNPPDRLAIAAVIQCDHTGATP